MNCYSKNGKSFAAQATIHLVVGPWLDQNGTRMQIGPLCTCLKISTVFLAENRCGADGKFRFSQSCPKGSSRNIDHHRLCYYSTSEEMIEVMFLLSPTDQCATPNCSFTCSENVNRRGAKTVTAGSLFWSRFCFCLPIAI